MEGYADPSTAAQDAMVNTLTCEVLKHFKKPRKQMLKSDYGITLNILLFLFFLIY